MENGNTVQELILQGVGEVRSDIKTMDAKVDRKMDLMNQRITDENTAIHNRITLEETKRIKTDVEMGSVKGRINWLYVIAGGLVVTFAGTVWAVLLSLGGK